jgi:hypothetical protein
MTIKIKNLYLEIFDKKGVTLKIFKLLKISYRNLFKF